MTLKLAIPDYSFPKLGWEQALRLARDLGFGALDIGLFAGRSHLRPEHLLSHPAQAAAQLTTALSSHGLEVADAMHIDAYELIHGAGEYLKDADEHKQGWLAERAANLLVLGLE